MKVTVLSRPGCHLCDEAVSDLREHLSARGAGEPQVEVEVVDIEGDDRLHRLYLEKIPVIMIGEETVSEFAFDPEGFDAALQSRHGRAG